MYIKYIYVKRANLSHLTPEKISKRCQNATLDSDNEAFCQFDYDKLGKKQKKMLLTLCF